MRIDDQHKQITVVKKEKYDILEEKGRKIDIQRRQLKHYAVKYNFHDKKKYDVFKYMRRRRY